jgi:hypothetical protein
VDFSFIEFIPEHIGATGRFTYLIPLLLSLQACTPTAIDELSAASPETGAHPGTPYPGSSLTTFVCFLCDSLFFNRYYESPTLVAIGTKRQHSSFTSLACFRYIT